MNLIAHYQILARYNRIANERLYEACARLSDAEYRKQRSGSFGGIHALLNHILLGDRIWMGRFEGGMKATPKPATILYDDFPALREARRAEDARIEAFAASLKEEFFDQSLEYVNSAGERHVDPAGLTIAHLFNHQTHHRAQVHVMLSAAGVQPPSLDMHRAIRPDPVAH